MVPSEWASGDSLNFKNAKGKQSVPGGIGLHPGTDVVKVLSIPGVTFNE